MTLGSNEPRVDLPRRRAAVDLVFVLGVFLLFSAALPWLDPVLRRGHGLSGVGALAGYQFACEGLAMVIVLAWRHERLGDYGLRRSHTGRSLALALALALAYDLGLSWRAGALLWLPFARQPAARMSVGAGMPEAVLGVAITVAVWGFLEGFFGVFFARKVNAVLRHSGHGWRSPGAFGFALFNGLVHVAVGQGPSGFITSFVSGYAIGVIPAVTGNAWGSGLVQSLTNAVGHL